MAEQRARARQPALGGGGAEKTERLVRLPLASPEEAAGRCWDGGLLGDAVADVRSSGASGDGTSLRFAAFGKKKGGK